MQQQIYSALKEYAGRIQNFSTRIQNWNEEEVKKYLIEPFLKILSWDTSDPDYVSHQFPITQGTSVTKADYALMLGERPICIIEAKPKEWNDDAVKQALSYAKAVDAPWALVTNGVRFCLYGVEFYKGEYIKNALIFDLTINIENLNGIYEQLSSLSNGKLDTEETAKYFRFLNESNAIVDYIRTNKETILKEIKKILEEKLSREHISDSVITDALGLVFGKVKIIKEPIESLTGGGERERHIGELEETTASEWKHLGSGIFVYKKDSSIRIDVSKPGPEVEKQLAKQGLKTTGPRAFGGFYYSLRREAHLIKSKY